VAGSVQAGRSGIVYRSIAVNQTPFMAHRLIWKWWYGEEPPECIDHLDGDGDNNRIENLRAADDFINAKNRRLDKRSLSGVSGVRFDHRSGKWKAQITVDKKQRHLGYYEDLNDAVVARREAESGHGFTARHGRPA